jgi:ribosomal protein S18 acetylase RimI-like enzyme
MPGVTIRDAGEHDLEGLAALEERCFAGDRLARRSLRRLIGARTARLRVAARPKSETAAAILGYHVVLFRQGSSIARLYSIAVDASRRGIGLGRRLLADAEAVAAAARRRVLRLEVREGNRRAIGLYVAHGYRPIGRWPGYYADSADALRYEKALSPGRLRRGRKA